MNLSNEEWRPVIGYEGLYSVSNTGRVRSETRKVKTSAGVREYRGRVLKPFWNSGRHLAVTLSDKGTRRKKWLVHRLVLAAFVGPPPEGYEGCHVNDVGDDNRVENLYWGTPSDNMNDRVKNGLHHYAKKTACKRGHLFTEDNTRINKYGNRQCIACQKLRRGGLLE